MKLLQRPKEIVSELFGTLSLCWQKQKETTKGAILTFVLCAVFIAAGYYCITYEYYAIAFLPLALLVLLFVLFKFKYALLLVAFAVPLSIDMQFGESALSLPSEVLLILITLLFLWQAFFKSEYDIRILRNPVSLFLILGLSWTLVTSFFSEIPLASFKYLLSKLWFVIPCYFLCVTLVKGVSGIRMFYIAHSLSFVAVIVYSTFSLLTEGVELSTAHYVMQPFYNDHTAYGAILALWFPLSLYFSFSDRKVCPNVYYRVLFVLISLFVLLGFVLSYSRAAWLSMFGAIGVFVLVKMRMKLKTFLVLSGSCILILLVFWNSIVGFLQGNEQDSSGNIAEHITSMTNISTDASNVERLNRWACALLMFKDSPVVGLGPGTYQFLYSGYQKSANLTIISTDSGDLGSTHSEYLKPLSEEGFPGMLFVICLFISTIFVGIRAYNRTEDKALANAALFLTMSLCTYYVHALMNNFLETEKLSVPFWCMTAMTVAIDVYAKKKKTESNSIKMDSEKKKIFSEKKKLESSSGKSE